MFKIVGKNSSLWARMLTFIVVLLIAIIVGGWLAQLLVPRVEIPEDCSQWNDNHVMEISIIIGGLLGFGTLSLIGNRGWI